MMPAFAALIGLDGVVLIVPIIVDKFVFEYAVAVIASPAVTTLTAAAAWPIQTSLTTEVVIVPETALDNLR